MSLKQVKQIRSILVFGAVACLLLPMVLQRAAVPLAILMMVLAVAIIALNALFWRCPHCKKNLGRDSKKICRHCGEELDL